MAEMKAFKEAADIANRTSKNLDRFIEFYIEKEKKADASGAGAPLTAEALTDALEKHSHKEHNGQIIRPADFDFMNPGDEVFSLPAEPRNPPDTSTIVKNESHLFKSCELQMSTGSTARPDR